jgi:hypothetical protein
VIQQTQIAGSIGTEKEIVRCVWPRLDCGSLQALESPYRIVYVERDVLATMPRYPNPGGETRISLVPLDQQMGDKALEEEFLQSQGLMAADPFALSAVLKRDSRFAESHRVGTHWRYRGEWFRITFGKWSHGRQLVVAGHSKEIWPADFWFAGIPFPATRSH